MSIITNLGPLFAVIVIGALLKTLGILPAEAAPLIARVVMTLTLPALNSSAEMLFLVAGKEKRGILSRVLSGEDLPANRCRATGQTIWLVDQAAHPDDVIERE